MSEQAICVECGKTARYHAKRSVREACPAGDERGSYKKNPTVPRACPDCGSISCTCGTRTEQAEARLRRTLHRIRRMTAPENAEGDPWQIVEQVWHEASEGLRTGREGRDDG